jgi:hypothetical protein
MHHVGLGVVETYQRAKKRIMSTPSGARRTYPDACPASLRYRLGRRCSGRSAWNSMPRHLLHVALWIAAHDMGAGPATTNLPRGTHRAHTAASAEEFFLASRTVSQHCLGYRATRWASRASVFSIFCRAGCPHVARPPRQDVREQSAGFKLRPLVTERRQKARSQLRGKVPQHPSIRSRMPGKCLSKVHRS